jgi:hypothetical protein
MAGDINIKRPFCNSEVSGEKMLHLGDVNRSEISAPQRPTHYPPARRGDVLDIVVHKNITPHGF